MGKKAKKVEEVVVSKSSKQAVLKKKIAKLQAQLK